MGVIGAMEALQSFGPYAIVVFLGIAYWRKDKQITDLMDKLSKLIQDKTVADTKLELALTGLRDVVTVLINKMR